MAAVPGIPNVPTMPQQNLTQNVSNMSTDQIIDQLQNNKNLSPQDKQTLMDELLKRLGGNNNNNGGGGGGGDPLQEILNKLMRGESLTPEEEKFLKDKTKGSHDPGGAPPSGAPTGNQV